MSIFRNSHKLFELDRCVRRITRLRDDSAGVVAIIFALAIIPVLLAGVLAVDFARVRSTERWLQAAVDTAVLAGVSSGGSDAVGVAERFFHENAPDQELPGTHAVFTLAADGTLSGTASAQLPLLAGGLFKTKKADLDATASAWRPTAKYQSFTFTPTSAQGAFNKDVYVVTRDSKGNVIKSSLALSYSYNTKTGKKTTSPALGTPITISLGPYESVALMMRVWWQNWGTRTGAYDDYYSDAPAPKIRTTGKCETGQTNNWEDGGDSNYMDFIYTMTCQSTSVTGISRLVK